MGALLRKCFNTSRNNNNFTVQTVSETCVQCDRHFDPRHTANDVYIIRCCDQWSAVAVRVTPARSRTSTDQRCWIPAVIHSLLQSPSPPNGDLKFKFGFKSRLLGHIMYVRLNEATFSRRRCAIVSRNVRWRLAYRPAVEFVEIKLASCHLLLYI